MKKLLLLVLVLGVSGVISAHNDTIIRHFTDTVTTVTMVQDSTLKQREELIPADSTDRRGHYIEAHVGIGYGTLGYGLRGTESVVKGSVSALFQLQYAWFFHQNWGIGAGLWFTDYMSYAHPGGQYKWLDQTDTDTEQHYDHISDIRRWKERQTIHNIGIPLSLQFQWLPEDKKYGIFAALGVAPSFTVMTKYRIEEGTVAHSGYYPAWNLTLDDVHEFGVKNYENEDWSVGNMKLRPQAAIFADLGLLVQLTRQIDLFVGGYANVSANDAHSSSQSERTPIGWRDKTFTFMDPYVGAYELDMAGPSHPWEAGVKIGVHWHYVPRPTPKMVDYFEYSTRPDTTYEYVTRTDTAIIAHLHDTVVPEENGPARHTNRHRIAKEIESFNKIYFAFDSHKLSDKAKEQIDHIAEVLGSDTDVEISVCGHASIEGEDAYNDILSRRRAEAVAKYLIGKGIDKERLSIKYFGSRVPNEDTELEERRRDRRVEVIVEEETNNQ